MFALQLSETKMSQKCGHQVERHEIAQSFLSGFNVNLRAGALRGFLIVKRKLFKLASDLSFGDFLSAAAPRPLLWKKDNLYLFTSMFRANRFSVCNSHLLFGVRPPPPLRRGRGPSVSSGRPFRGRFVSADERSEELQKRAGRLCHAEHSDDGFAAVIILAEKD
jgi:hypothetical protein